MNTENENGFPRKETDNSNANRTPRGSGGSGEDNLQRLGILAKIYKKKVSPLWMRLAVCLGVVFAVFLVIAIVIMSKNNTATHEARIANGELQQDLDAQNSVLLAENKKYAEKILLSAFDTAQLENLAKDNWTYAVTVNNVAVTGGSITVKSPNIIIKINEKEKDNDLPDSISAMGSISKGNPDMKLDDIIKITTSVDKSQIVSSVTYNDVTSETTYSLSISNVPVGDIVTIDLGTDLASRMRIDSGYIEIFHPTNS